MVRLSFCWLLACAVLLVDPGYAAEVPPRIVVLQYHHVSESTPASTSISPARFAEHMQWLVDNDFEVASLGDSLVKLRAGESLPDRLAVITFDDGYQSIYTEAFPVLREHGFPFTVFVNSTPHDAGKEAWMSWDELREIAAAGATIANHTESHAFLLRRQDGPDCGDAGEGSDSLPSAACQSGGESTEHWLARVRAEIQTAERRIEQETGQSHRLLAYPYGESDTAIRELVANMGYTAFGQQSGPIGPGSDMQNLPRFPLAGPYAAMDTFQTKMLSLPLDVQSATPGSRSGDALLDFDEPSPSLELHLAGPADGVLNCFASGQGGIPVTRVAEDRVEVAAPESLAVGRSRYNCTLASAWPGRYHWYSYAWVRRGQGNRWRHQ